MNYTINEAKKIRVGDKLTLDDGTVHESVKSGDDFCDCKDCSLSNKNCNVIMCNEYDFHFKQIK